MLLVPVSFCSFIPVVILRYFVNKLVNRKLVSVVAMSTVLAVLHFGFRSGIRVLHLELKREGANYKDDHYWATQNPY